MMRVKANRQTNIERTKEGTLPSMNWAHTNCMTTSCLALRAIDYRHYNEMFHSFIFVLYRSLLNGLGV